MGTELRWTPGSGWAVQPALGSLGSLGAKAVGLAVVPEAWCPPWVVVTLESCARAEQTCAWLGVAEAVLAYLNKIAPSNRTGLIARSSAPTENMDLRGHFDSKRCGMAESELAEAMQWVAYQMAANSEMKQPVCAVVVQLFLAPDLIGHLSNEYRHAQRSVDFLFEAEATLSDSPSVGPRAFRLHRPVAAPDVSAPITLNQHYIDGALQGALSVLGSWLANENRRGHVEWVVSGGRLHVVQFDADVLPPRIQPMSELAVAAPALGANIVGLEVFELVSQQDFSFLRKTRSHALLLKADAFVPPIFVALNVGKDLFLGDAPFWRDLRKLLCSPAIIRFDVPLDKPDWTNLPTIGPLTSLDEARVKIAEAANRVMNRSVQLEELSVVVHHFIAARASAWSEALPNSPSVRIDAAWGLPDGLQSFVHDSLECDLALGTVTPYVRYKDRYIDVSANGEWVTRKAYPTLAGDQACGVEAAREIARVTQRVAAITSAPVRIMWFLDVLQGGGGQAPSAMPWIVVEIDKAVAAGVPWTSAMENLRRSADLHARKAVANRLTLARFRKDPSAMDVGGRHVLLQPDASVVRDRQFLQEFAKVIVSLPNQWKVLYSGSMLAHAPYQLQQLGVAVLPIHADLRPPRRTYMRKLVRDLIPARIAAGGEHAEVVELTTDQFALALRQKLIEEALEVAYAADSTEVAEELADLLTVAKAVAVAAGIKSWDWVQESEREKTTRRGAFESRLYLRATGNPQGTGDSAPGGAPIQRLKGGDGIRIPLIPPLRSPDREQRFSLPRLGVEIVVRFREYEVDVSLSLMEIPRERDEGQLLLFP